MSVAVSPMNTFRDLVDLPKVVTPYLFHPLSAAEIFLPHVRPISWLTGSGNFQPDRDIPALTDKVILVTGGNAGLGQESVCQLAKHQPAKIYLAARSSDKAKSAIEDLNQRLARDDMKTKPCIQFLPLDLSDFDSVERAAQKVFTDTKRLDILMLNAGIMAVPPSKSKSGHDLQLSTNHMGHFLLVNLLMPLLEQTASDCIDSDVRIVTVASEAHNMAPANFLDLIENHDQLCSASNYTRYGVSKAANILFASELARRVAAKSIISVSLHPGIIVTQLYDSAKDSNILVRLGLPPFARLVFDDLSRGALGQLFLAAGARKETIVNGGYYTPVGRHQNIALTDDMEQADRLWRWTENQLKDFVT